MSDEAGLIYKYKVPFLLMGSEEDELVRTDFQEEYGSMAAETDAQLTAHPYTQRKG